MWIWISLGIVIGIAGLIAAGGLGFIIGRVTADYD